MRQNIKSYFQFSRGEWVAIVVLLALSLSAYLIYFFYDAKVDSPFDIASFEQEIELFEQNQREIADSLQRVREQRQEEYRKQYEEKYKKKDYSKKDKSYWKRENHYLSSFSDSDSTAKKFNEKKKTPAYKIVKVELNSCDTNDITRVPRFGIKRAQKIVEYRDRLGGFHSLEQLQEIYIIRDVEVSFMTNYFEIDSKKIRKLDINRATYKELMAHPYFDAYLAKGVLSYREKKGKIKNIDEFKRCTNAYEELLKKIEPYLLFSD